MCHIHVIHGGFQILSIIGLVEAIYEKCSKNNFEWEIMSGCHGNGHTIFWLLSVVKSFKNQLNHHISEPDYEYNHSFFINFHI